MFIAVMIQAFRAVDRLPPSWILLGVSVTLHMLSELLTVAEKLSLGADHQTENEVHML